MSAGPQSLAPVPSPDDPYVVVARRYRPQTFADLVGQEQAVRALTNAIRSHRVAHAYLFTGARGVGKTSTARILAKALNCERGTSTEPCNECETCRAISVGQDLDVLEIDGASNRGIDEMRDLRQNAAVRPTRSRSKIYIIDEVHMLTKEAFNALLKTLEEPPEHVKFIFCTTEPEKIPITILSRCQRFDFGEIRAPRIAERLAQIVETEGRRIEPAAVQALSRRAAGSMRDAQSLLDQLLAFGGDTITAAEVHSMLGTADDVRVGQIILALVERQPANLLQELDAALAEGVDGGQLVDQILGYLRDLMVSSVGCDSGALLFTSESEHARVQTLSRRLGIETILAMMQILAETKSRLRYSNQVRILVELALVRCCRLEDLDELPKLIGQLRGTLPLGEPRPAPPRASAPASGPNPGPTSSSGPAAHSGPASNPGASSGSTTARPSVSSEDASAAAQKKNALSRSEPPRAAEPAAVPSRPASAAGLHSGTALTAETYSTERLASLWEQILANLGNMIAEHAGRCERLAISAPNRLVLTFPAKYTFHKSYCERPERAAKLQEALAQFTGQAVQLEFRVSSDESVGGPAAPPVPAPRPAAAPVSLSHPLVRRALDLFQGRVIRAEPPPGNAPPGNAPKVE